MEERVVSQGRTLDDASDHDVNDYIILNQDENRQSAQFQGHDQPIYSKILVVLIMLLCAYLFLQSRLLSDQLGQVRSSLLNQDQNLNSLKRTVQGLDLQIISSNNNQKNSIQEANKHLELINKNEEIQRGQLQQQLIKVLRELVKIKKSNNEPKEIPKIFWLYTDSRFAAERMIEQILAKSTIKLAKDSNLSIRIVNAEDAYNWLSSSTALKITKTMQNIKIEQKVSQLLRLALLMEHGGILVRLDKLLLVQNFDWVFKFSKNEVVLFAEQASLEMEPIYQDHFIAAAKGAELIVDAFNALCLTLSTGKIQFKQLLTAMQTNPATNSIHIKQITKNILAALIESMTSSFYSVKIVTINLSKRLSAECDGPLFELMKSERAKFDEVCGKPRYFIHRFNRSSLEQAIQGSMKADRSVTDAIPTNSYWYQMLDLQNSIQYFRPPPLRTVKFCLLDAEADQSLDKIKQSVQALKKQSYQNWVAVFFIQETWSEIEQYAKSNSNQKQTIKIAMNSESLGHNYQQGIIRYCPQKSFIVVLKRSERLASSNALEQLAYKLGASGVLGAFVSVNVSGQIKRPETTLENYSKLNTVNNSAISAEPSNIVNFLRVFHSDYYKIIPQFELRTHQGVYFNDRFNFLEHFVYMVRNQTSFDHKSRNMYTEKVEWFIRTNRYIFDVPNQIILHPSTVINVPAWEEVDREELAQKRFKSEPLPIVWAIDHLVRNGQTIQEFAVFNPAKIYEPSSQRKKPQVIPKIIHQIWIKGEMPNFNKQIIEMNKKMYPDFHFKLWTQQNINRQNFPHSYDLLLNILGSDINSSFSKVSTAVYVMRNELLYNEGGFYLETDLLLFNTALVKWLTYNLVICAEKVFMHRQASPTSFVGVAPKFPGLLRIVSFNNTNMYNIFGSNSGQNARSYDFRKLIRGDQEYNSDYLILPHDAFYPAPPSLADSSQTYCLIQPENLKAGQQGVVRVQNKVLISNCGRYYPTSFGVRISPKKESMEDV